MRAVAHGERSAEAVVAIRCGSVRLMLLRRYVLLLLVLIVERVSVGCSCGLCKTKCACL